MITMTMGLQIQTCQNRRVRNEILEQSITKFAVKQQEKYDANTSADIRKKIGHFGTPAVIAEFMTTMFTNIPTGNVRLLDPGAGVGVLTAAVCDRIAQINTPMKVEAVLYENEPELITILEQTMTVAKKVLKEHGHKLQFTIHEKDFILSNAPLENNLSRINGSEHETFDMIIMNPPYYKLRKDSEQAKAMSHIVHGQPNIYALFMAIGAQLLRKGGEIIAITPRSYCNGLYFRDFRKWFFERITPFHIHMFESRKHAFHENGVLQEHIILAGKHDKHNGDVAITVNKGRDLQNSERHDVPIHRVIDDSTENKIIRISSNALDQRITDIIDTWPIRFKDMGLSISTGPVVTFRAREHLLDKKDKTESVPLILAHNVKPFITLWPSKKSKKDTFFKVCDESLSLLLQVKNYLILKRFTTKEEKRRLVAGILLADDYLFTHLALENHLNYVYKSDGELSKPEIYGLAALFNSALLDRYFRTINGNTQVNATEIRTLPLPQLKYIRKIGEQIMKLNQPDATEIEGLILDYLKINGEIKNYLKDIA